MSNYKEVSPVDPFEVAVGNAAWQGVCPASCGGVVQTPFDVVVKDGIVKGRAACNFCGAEGVPFEFSWPPK